MGLAGTRTKQRFGLDPRNTNWSNNTERFGHQHLVKLGWNPGSGLGLSNNSITSHIKITVKNDNLGLGANLAKKKNKTDEFDSGENVHLDAFQRLLGKLNGKEEEINKEVDRKRTERIINGRWGVHFVKGSTLSSTWDKANKQLKTTDVSDKKRQRDDGNDDESEIKPESKKSKKDKKDKKDRKDRKDRKDKKVKKQKKEKKDKKNKKDKKDKKEKKSKIEKKEKRSKKDKKDKKSKFDVTRESMLKPKEELSTANVTGSKMALRGKWIRQKRAAVMDEKALQEIFMIK
ncbi:telomerase inhibitor [Pichia kluyveri]|uniref:Protein PXR1 n=1 Tax=Pichia kluyveri TaxID=36015 RepID=A0AAV5QZC4_PICKL|nr:telomerase inhibitor [Pichia kluyveri]